MLERIYDHLTSLGLPDVAVKVLLGAVLCVPLVLLILCLPNVMSGSSASPSYAAAAPSDASEATTSQSRGPITSTPHLKTKVGVYEAPDDAPKTIHPDSKQAKFKQVRKGMTVQEVHAIMGDGDILTEGRIPSGDSSALHLYHYKNNLCQMVLYGNDRVREIIEKQFEK